MRSAERESGLLARRTRLVFWGFALSLLVFCGRLYDLQVVSVEQWRESSQANSVKRRALPASRGLIRDASGRLLVGNRLAHDLVLDREAELDPEGVASFVESLTGEPREAILEAIRVADETQPDHVPLVLARDLSFSQVAWLEARRERAPALSVRTEVLRQYPNGSLASHVLGHVGEIDARGLLDPELAARHRMGDLVGKAGVEKEQDRWLTGERGVRRVVVDNVGREISSTVELPPRAGHDVHLTIDLAVQRAAEAALAGQRGACVVLDPRDGSVRALVSAPGYEPEAFVGGISDVRWQQLNDDPGKPLRFRAISEIYPPGSVWKPLMAAAGLMEGVRQPSDETTCLGVAHVHGRRRCWKKIGHGALDMRGSLINSCNVYYYHLGRDLGITPIERLAADIGFGRLAGIDLAGEKPGILPSDPWKRREVGERWYDGDTINVAIGQGFLSVTPLQVAQLAASIAARGDVHRPHVFSHAVDPRTGEVVDRWEGERPVRVPYDSATLDFLHEAMVATVEDGTGRRARVPGVTVAGKTGTAQPSSGDAPEDMPDEEVPDRYREHAWFMGFAPAESPELAFAVVVEHAGKHGGEVAAPVARSVIEAWARAHVTVTGQ